MSDECCARVRDEIQDELSETWSELEKLKLEIQKLKEREKKLIKCAEFYACGIKTHIADADYPYCSDYDISNNLFWYGKLARQTLKELGIKKE